MKRNYPRLKTGKLTIETAQAIARVVNTKAGLAKGLDVSKPTLDKWLEEKGLKAVYTMNLVSINKPGFPDNSKTTGIAG